MSLVRPFPAWIVKAEHAADVVCPMHDALSPTDREELLNSNALSYLNVTRSTLDMPGASYEEIGAANAKGLEHLMDAGVYGELNPPALYIYRIDRDGDVHTGIVADMDVHGFVDGRVLGHEAVQQERVSALVSHFEAVPARSELVALMHPNDPDVSSIVATTIKHDPLLELTDITGVQQSVWRIADDDVPLVSERLAAMRHYVADGHHRVAATVARWREHGSPRGGNVLCVLYPEDQTHLLAFHRQVVGPVDARRLLDDLARYWDLTMVDGPSTTHGEFGLHLAGRWYRVRPTGLTRGAGTAGLDVTVLDQHILRPLLGTASGDDRVRYVSELTDLDEVIAEEPGGALFLLAAPSHAQLIAVADRGEVMPQKSTYIEPKPRAGIFLRPRQGPVDPKDLPPAA
jgi:uncharacterized protein (DUF1015 family)